MLGDMDIEVGVPEEPGTKPGEQVWVEERPEREETERAPDTTDPVRMYLKEMSRIPLLTREEEVAISKEIEAGEHEVRVAVFSLDAALDYVIGLGERLRAAEIETAHIFDRLKEAKRRVDTALREIQHVESRFGQSAATIIKHAPRLRAEGKETAELARSMFKAPAADVVRAGTRIHENRGRVQQVLREIDMAADALPAVLETIRRGEIKALEGKRRLIEANLRLVVSIARRSMNRGVGFLDLIQEG